MHEKIDALRARLDSLRSESIALVELVHELTDLLRKGSLADADLVDLGFLCREAASEFEEHRKELGARKDACTEALVKRALAKADEDVEFTVRGELATASLDVEQQLAIHELTEKQLAELGKEWGVSENAIRSGVFKLSYTGVAKHVSRLIEDGKPVSSHYGKMRPKCVAVYRARPRKRVE